MRESLSAGPSAKASVPRTQNPSVGARTIGLGPPSQSTSIGAILLKEAARRSIDQSPRIKPPTSAEEREDKAFGEQLPNDTSAAAAERETDRDFFPPRRPAGEQHVGQIQASHEQDHAAMPEIITPTA